MTRLHDVNDNARPTAYLVGVPTRSITDQDNESSLDELKRLCHTLGYDVIGRTSQRRSGTGGAFVLGEGKIVQLAKLTGGPGAVAAGPVVPHAANPKRKKAFRNQKEADELEDEDDDVDEEFETEFGQPDETQAVSTSSNEDGELEGLGSAAPESWSLILG